MAFSAKTTVPEEMNLGKITITLVCLTEKDLLNYYLGMLDDKTLKPEARKWYEERYADCCQEIVDDRREPLNAIESALHKGKYVIIWLGGPARDEHDQIIVVCGSETLYPYHSNLAETYQWVHNVQEQKKPKIESVAPLDWVINKTVPFTNVAGGGTFSVDIVGGKPRSLELGDYFSSQSYGSPVRTFGEQDWKNISSLCKPLGAEVFQQQDIVYQQNQVEGKGPQLEYPPGNDLPAYAVD